MGNPSRFKRRIELMERTLTIGSLQQEIETYKSWGKLWTDIKTIRGREYVEANTEKQNLVTRFIVRHSKTLERFMQAEKTYFEIVHNGVTYDVKDAVNDDDLNLTITIMAEARV